MRWAAGLALLLLLRPSAAGADEIRRVALTTGDLAYDRVTRRIYASIPARARAGAAPADSVAILDPATGAVEAAVPIGADPARLALSEEGRYLYVALDGVPAVRRLLLATRAPDLQFSLGEAPGGSAYAAADLAVLPGRPESVAVVRQIRGFARGRGGVALYDDGVMRPKAPVEFRELSDRIAFDGEAGTLYGFELDFPPWGLRRMAVGPDGVSVVESVRMPGLIDDVAVERGVAVTSSGLAIDLSRLRLTGVFPLDGATGLVASDRANGRVFFLSGQGSTRTLRAFDAESFLPVGALAVPGVVGRARGLLRWGEDGLAFRTEGGQIFLIRTALAR